MLFLYYTSIKIALIHELYTHLTLVFDCIGTTRGVSVILIYEYSAQGSPHPRRGQVNTCGFYPLNSVSLYFVVWRRPETWRPLEIGIRRGFFLPYVSQHIRSVECRTAAHMVYSAGATQGELPKSREEDYFEITVLRNSFTRCYGQHLNSTLPTNFTTAGCAKVNCPKGKRRSSGGYPCRATRGLVITETAPTNIIH